MIRGDRDRDREGFPPKNLKGCDDMKKELAEKRILSYVNGLLYFYGVMDFTGLYRAALDNLPFTPEMDTFRLILEKETFKAESPYDFDCDDNFYFHLDVEDVDWVWEEQGVRDKIPYRPVTEEQARLIMEKKYSSLWTPPVRKLYTLLQEEFGWSKEEALQTILHSQKLLRNGLEPMDVVNEFLGKTQFRGLEEVKSLMDTVMEMTNHTPLWILKGWTPHEVLEKEKAQEKEKRRESKTFFAAPTGGIPAGTEPTLEEWSSLYEAAAAFKEAGCWEWMYDDDLFGVMDPETGEIAYCCIMGNLGEHYALGAYLGAEGLNSILEILSSDAEDEEDAYFPDSFFKQKCLMASFRNRDELAKEDREIIKKLGLKFRGNNNWPLFRSYEPGLFPWFLNARECRFLTVALQQSLEVALRCRRDKAILEHEKPFTFLVRVPEKEGERIVWSDRYLEASLPVKEYISFTIADELYLKKIVKSLRRGKDIWEAEAFWVPYPVQEAKNKRPYYPVVFLIVDRTSGLILGHELLKNLQEDGYSCINLLLKVVSKGGLAPSRIVVRRQETYCLLEKACRQLEIPLEKVERLKVIPAVREEMLNANLFDI